MPAEDRQKNHAVTGPQKKEKYRGVQPDLRTDSADRGTLFLRRPPAVHQGNQHLGQDEINEDDNKAHPVNTEDADGLDKPVLFIERVGQQGGGPKW